MLSGEDNENGEKTTIGLISKKKQLCMCSILFLHISLSLFDIKTVSQISLLVLESKVSCMAIKTLFTWSGGPRFSGVGFFCFVSPRA